MDVYQPRNHMFVYQWNRTCCNRDNTENKRKQGKAYNLHCFELCLFLQTRRKHLTLQLEAAVQTAANHNIKHNSEIKDTKKKNHCKTIEQWS